MSTDKDASCLCLGVQSSHLAASPGAELIRYVNHTEAVNVAWQPVLAVFTCSAAAAAAARSFRAMSRMHSSAYPL